MRSEGFVAASRRDTIQASTSLASQPVARPLGTIRKGFGKTPSLTIEKILLCDRPSLAATSWCLMIRSAGFKAVFGFNSLRSIVFPPKEVLTMVI
jgi:hypothetical protein